MLFRLHRDIHTTAAATLKIVDFVRALTIDPCAVWAPHGNWNSIKAIRDVLRNTEFSPDKLVDILDEVDVCNLR